MSKGAQMSDQANQSEKGVCKPVARPPMMSLEDQLRRIMPYMECPVVFLAGVRFAQGFVEYGDELMTMSDDALELARMEEHADQLVYEAEQMARKADD